MRFWTETAAPKTLTYIIGGRLEETRWFNNISEVAVTSVFAGLDSMCSELLQVHSICRHSCLCLAHLKKGVCSMFESDVTSSDYDLLFALT